MQTVYHSQRDELTAVLDRAIGALASAKLRFVNALDRVPETPDERVAAAETHELIFDAARDACIDLLTGVAGLSGWVGNVDVMQKHLGLDLRGLLNDAVLSTMIHPDDVDDVEQVAEAAE